MLQDSRIVQTLPLFSELTSGEITEVERQSALTRRERGEYLFLHGDDISKFFVVCRGTMQIFRETPDGHEITSDILIAGDCINADEIIGRQSTHMTNARVVDDGLILEVSIEWMRQHLRDFDSLAPRLLQSLSERLHSAQKEAEHRSTLSASQIVACYLQGLCVLHDLNPAGFKLPYSKTLIASRLRMELATFSRTLQKLRSRGIVVDGNTVAFTNLTRAGEFVCDDCSISSTCATRQNMLESAAKFGA